MLYIGHFSFDEDDFTGSERHGYFTMVTTAQSADEALQMFKTAIKERKGKDAIFDPILAVYIEDIIQIPELPQAPIITRLQSSAGEFPESVSHSLPGVEQDGIEAYGFAVDLKQIETQPVDDYKEMTPFIRF